MSKTGISLKKRLTLNVFKKYKKAQAQVHELKYLFWECTLRCNLGCIHCGSDCTRKSDIKDMPVRDFLSVIDHIKERYDSHRIMVVFTGGEPLLRKDLAECGYALYSREFPWGMVSNGYHMTGQRLESLLRAGLRSLTISLDGLQAAHNWLRGKKDSFTRTINAVEHAAGVDDLVFDVVTCVNKRNYHELNDIKELLIAKKVKRWRLFTIFPKGRAVGNDELLLNKVQFTGLMEFIKNVRREKRIHCNYECGGFLGRYEQEVRDNLFFCWAGINVASILADGSISACPSLGRDFIQGNIYRDDFIDVWENRYAVMRDRSWTKKGHCASCESYSWCEGNGLHFNVEGSGELLQCHYALTK